MIRKPRKAALMARSGNCEQPMGDEMGADWEYRCRTFSRCQAPFAKDPFTAGEAPQIRASLQGSEASNESRFHVVLPLSSR
jgi:hypothetical protein